MYQRNEAAAARSCIHACELVYGSPSDGAVWARELEPHHNPPVPYPHPDQAELAVECAAAVSLARDHSRSLVCGHQEGSYCTKAVYRRL